MMKIFHEETKNKGAFYVGDNGDKVGELTYQKDAPGEITIDHTEVSEKFRGEGIAQDLVAEAVKWARENKLKINPTCPYAKKIIDETPGFGDVLA
jgi:uncharacterized protein